MGTRMLLFPGEEHMHRAPSWGGMHEPDVGNPSWMAPYSQGGGGNTWSKRLAASSNDSDSWEVRAFAEDASTSGQWPPRSYSCSFCQREFRTAQALGGHMNVHRRERAQANQLAQLRSTSGTEAHNNNVSTPDNNNNHWLTRSSHESTQPGDHHYSRGGYESYRHAQVDDSSYTAASYGAPSAPFRNSPPTYEPAWRSSTPYDTPSHDYSGLDLELRLGQRYD